MDKAIKAKWLTALRGGKYRQGSGFLKIKGQNGAQDRFCCLGVLCELAVEAGVTELLRETYETRYGKVGDTNTAVLPIHVQEWAGINKAGSYSDGTEGHGESDNRSLAGDNDGGMTFLQIADIIEEKF